MATQIDPSTPAVHSTPELRDGDQLDGAEFERRWVAMPWLKHAELIKGVVFMPSPVRFRVHGRPHNWFSLWAGTYAAYTPGVECGSDSTVRLDPENRPQPDVQLLIDADCGGQARLEDDYVTGAPELAAEIAASTVSRDLHDKRDVYEQTGIREYVVWRVEDGAVDYLVLRDGRYSLLEPTPAGVYHSEVFPGLRLDAAALLRSDPAGMLRTLHEGLASIEHADFVVRLGLRRSPPHREDGP